MFKTTLIVLNMFLKQSLQKQFYEIHTPTQPHNQSASIDDNQTPVIGIFSQTLEDYMKDDPRFSNYTSYIMGAYVRYIEASGARVVPLIESEEEAILLDKLNHVNGVLFPGGDGDYYEKGRFAFNKIVEFNKQNKTYPLWGTCLGYEYLVAYTTDLGLDSWGIYDYHNVSLPIFYTKDPKKSKMFEGLGDRDWEFSTKNLTYNSHKYGISPELMLNDPQLKEFWDMTSISLMPNGTEFTASIEAKNYPIFGT